MNKQMKNLKRNCWHVFLLTLFCGWIISGLILIIADPILYDYVDHPWNVVYSFILGHSITAGLVAKHVFDE